MSCKQKLAAVLGTLLMATAVLSGCSSQSSSPNSASAGGQAASQQSAGEMIKAFNVHFEAADDSPTAAATNEFARILSEKSNGRLTAVGHPNGVLSAGNQTKAIEMVQNGSIDFGWQSTMVLTNIEPKFGSLGIPFLFSGFDSVDKTLNVNSEIGQEIQSWMNAKGMVVLSFGENGFREITNNVREIHSPEDLKGLKMRVVGNKMLHDMFTLMGANPISMNWSEVFTALQQGTIDGQENPIVNTFIPNRVYEVQKHISIWGYSYDGYLLTTNSKLFDSLSDEDKEVVKEAALAAAQMQKDIIRAGMQEGIQLLIDEGMQVYELTPEELTVFKAAAAPVVENYMEEFGGVDFVNKLIEFAQS